MEVTYHSITKNISYKKGNRRVLERYFIDKILLGHSIYLNDVSYKIVLILAVDLYNQVYKFVLEEEE